MEIWEQTQSRGFGWVGGEKGDELCLEIRQVGWEEVRLRKEWGWDGDGKSLYCPLAAPTVGTPFTWANMLWGAWRPVSR
jgi:hypothetical protein